MKLTFSKIYFLIFVITLGGLSFWGYKIIRKQNGGSPKTTTSQINQNKNSNAQNDQSNIIDNSSVSTTTDSSLSGNSLNASATTAPSTDLNNRNNATGSILAHITTEHCNTNCSAFANDLQLLEYCQQVCGIIPVKPVTNCDSKTGIEKDYCLKDLSITKENSSICDQISDVNVKQTCQNRIAQDIIENQN